MLLQVPAAPLTVVQQPLGIHSMLEDRRDLATTGFTLSTEPFTVIEQAEVDAQCDTFSTADAVIMNL